MEQGHVQQSLGPIEIRIADQMSEEILEKTSFEKRYRKLRKSFAKKLKSFLLDANEANTHEIRTAIRKLDASLQLLPKKVQKSKKTRRFVKATKKVMKESAEVRDLDVIAARISRHPQSAARKKLLQKIEKSREKHAEKALHLAVSASKLSLPKPGLKDFPNSKLQKRFSKLLQELSERVNSSLPIVLDDPNNIEEVHSLRKYCKRMRYLFELATEKESEMVGDLKSWQDLLGNVHDGDVAISYLKRSKKTKEIEEMMATELRDRNHDYEKFVQTCIRH